MPVSPRVSTTSFRDSLVLPGLVLACLIGAGFTGVAFGKDGDDDSGAANATRATPNIYLDLRTSYATVPAGALPVGFGSSALFSALQSLALANGGSLPTSVPLASRQSLAVDFPLTVDVTDTVSLYAGISGTTTYGPAQGWSSFDVTSWNVGFQADIYSQNGGSIPTITWQSTITQAIPNGPAGTTTFNNVLEFDYAFDEDATRGMLAGIQDTRVEVATALVRIHPNIIGYVGGYYQWPSNWKFTGRVGVQYFGGAQLLSMTPIQPFAQPILRLDLDRTDDNDNRLFGVTAQIMWVPKPSYQLTLRTPLYLVRK
ncbi:hypothetical protein [Bradyrhizobium oropedii]|uniref:hypothetical protein n=1 Tax=Bradyrhizobium oropedii TaxID=1571201 RepID=UPI003B84B521